MGSNIKRSHHFTEEPLNVPTYLEIRMEISRKERLQKEHPQLIKAQFMILNLRHILFKYAC